MNATLPAARRFLPTLAAALCGLAPLHAAELQLAGVFSDHAVLERDVAVPVWGWAEPGTAVSVEFGGQKKSTTTDTAGKWMLRLDPMSASAEARTLKVEGGKTLTVSDVLVGEVWLASGQSNMGFTFPGAHNAATELPRAQDPQLRFFSVNKGTAAEPQADLKGKWEPTTPETVKGFSAVAYFFARELREKLGCPVAILHSSWGGTPAQAWLSMEALRQEPAITNYTQKWEQAFAKYQEVQAHPEWMDTYRSDLKKWQVEVAPGFNAALKEYNASKSTGPKPLPARPEPANPDPMGMPSPASRPGTPSVIYNAMIAPLAPYAMRGVIWYQGEANGSAGVEYRTLFPRLIGDWRAHWAQAELPFLFVQLPGWNHDTNPAQKHDWPWLREAQLMTLQSVPHTGMAITIDVGDPGNVHPTDKIDVAQRLALIARKSVYGEKLISSGPLYRNFSIEGGAIRVRLSEIGSGLAIGAAPWHPEGVEALPTDRLLGFVVAGEDRVWHEATAGIEGESVLISSPEVPKPVAARYAWANSPKCNLYNKENLPASPFRTDNWPLK